MSMVATTPDEVIEPTLEQVSEGVFAYLQLYGQWGLNNAGFIVGKDRALVVDTCFTVGRAQRFLAAIRKTTALPLTTLVNTHHHGDHTYGNFLFDQATIIAHERCRQEMIATGLSTQRLFAEGTDWGEIHVAPPFVTFTERLDLWVDDLKVEAHYVGPAHTTNDVVYYLPDRKLLFLGDLGFRGAMPFVVMGSVQGSLDAYARLAAFDVKTVVPGHGPVCGPEIFEDMAGYLRFVQELARAAEGSGTDALTAAREADLGEYAGWHEPERLVGNLHRAVAELRGQPLGHPMELAPIIADMAVINGGPLRCFA